MSEEKITLRRYDVSEEVFDDILQAMESKIQIVDKIEDYFRGYQPKQMVLYDNKEYLIIRESLLAYFAEFSNEDYQDIEDWRQVIVRKCHQPNTSYLRSIDGSRAYKHTKDRILEYYTEEEFEERLGLFEVEYDDLKAQYHYQYPSSNDVVLAHSNCVKYDINGAHCDALIQIFPKAKPMLKEMYDQRKANPLNKAYINYFVGMLCRKGHRKTYNWIVQRTTKTLKSAILYCGGDLIYANTDGFLVSNPEKKLKPSKALGKFKLEFEGTAYTYQDKNYWCYQAEKLCGSVRYQVRDLIDLKKGQVVHYDVKRKILANGTTVQTVNNVEKGKIDVYKNS